MRAVFRTDDMVEARVHPARSEQGCGGCDLGGGDDSTNVRLVETGEKLAEHGQRFDMLEAKLDEVLASQCVWPFGLLG